MVNKVDSLSKDFGNITVPFEVRCQSNAEVYDWGYSFKNRSIDRVLVAEVGSWFTGECYNFRLYWMCSDCSSVPDIKMDFSNIKLVIVA